LNYIIIDCVDLYSHQGAFGRSFVTGGAHQYRYLDASRAAQTGVTARSEIRDATKRTDMRAVRFAGGIKANKAAKGLMFSEGLNS
jgi:hypothetical protein